MRCGRRGRDGLLSNPSLPLDIPVRNLLGRYDRESIAGMRIPWISVVMLLGGVYSLYVASRLRKFKASDSPPASRAHLSLEERQRKMRTASMLAVLTGLLLIVGAGLFAWLETAN